ncbi:hypothetical protein AAMO2058_000856800 [Amorphochlora amoebiformis]
MHESNLLELELGLSLGRGGGVRRRETTRDAEDLKQELKRHKKEYRKLSRENKELKITAERLGEVLRQKEQSMHRVLAFKMEKSEQNLVCRKKQEEIASLRHHMVSVSRLCDKVRNLEATLIQRRKQILEAKHLIQNTNVPKLQKESKQHFEKASKLSRVLSALAEQLDIHDMRSMSARRNFNKMNSSLMSARSQMSTRRAQFRPLVAPVSIQSRPSSTTSATGVSQAQFRPLVPPVPNQEGSSLTTSASSFSQRKIAPVSIQSRPSPTSSATSISQTKPIIAPVSIQSRPSPTPSATSISQTQPIVAPVSIQSRPSPTPDATSISQTQPIIAPVSIKSRPSPTPSATSIPQRTRKTSLRGQPEAEAVPPRRNSTHTQLESASDDETLSLPERTLSFQITVDDIWVEEDTSLVMVLIQDDKEIHR